MQRTSIVVPCFNEERRLDFTEFARLLAEAPVDIVFVDDGSTDGTGALLQRFCSAHPARAQLLSLGQNQGKAEAVRQGMLRAAQQASCAGYFDADLATPVDEIARMVRHFESLEPKVRALLAARIPRGTASIERAAGRRLLGWLFARAATLALRLPVADTQCGAKLFRVDARLRIALSEPFRSRWIFDVELIDRLIRQSAREETNAEAFAEFPLQRWEAKGRSKLTGAAIIRSGFELLSMAAQLRKPRQAPRVR